MIITRFAILKKTNFWPELAEFKKIADKLAGYRWFEEEIKAGNRA